MFANTHKPQICTLFARKPEGRVFPSPHLFERNTISRECADLARVIEWIRVGDCDDVSPDSCVGLWGHSRGGVAVMLATLGDPTLQLSLGANIHFPESRWNWTLGIVEDAFSDMMPDFALHMEVRKTINP